MQEEAGLWKRGLFPTLPVEPGAGWGARGQAVGKGCSGPCVQVTKPCPHILTTCQDLSVKWPLLLKNHLHRYRNKKRGREEYCGGNVYSKSHSPVIRAPQSAGIQ